MEGNVLLLWFCAASPPDGHRLAVLVEAPAAVDVGVGGRRHRLLPGPDGLGCGEDERNQNWFYPAPPPWVRALSGLLTDLGRMAPPGHVLGPDSLLDAVHLLLVALAVTRGVLLGLLQSRLQGLDPFSRSTKALFQFRKLTAQVCIITHQLWGRSDRFHAATLTDRAASQRELPTCL